MYVEPFVQARVLVVVGATPVADALARLARSMDYQVTRVVDAREQADIESRGGGPRREGRHARRARGDPRRERRGHVRSSSRRRGTTTRRRSKRASRAARRTSASSRRASAARPSAPCSKNAASLASRRCGIRPASISARGPRRRSRCRSSRKSFRLLPSGTAVATSPAPAIAERCFKPPASRPTAIDPVCGMQVDVATARHTAEVDGVVYYFCCANCRARFVKQPQDYRRNTHDGRRDASAPASASTPSSWTRPSRPRCRSCSRSRSRCSSKARPASARPRAPRSSPRCWARG